MNWKDCKKANDLDVAEQELLLKATLMLGHWDGNEWLAFWQGRAWNLFMGDKILFDRCEVHGSGTSLKATHYVELSEFNLPGPRC